MRIQIQIAIATLGALVLLLGGIVFGKSTRDAEVGDLRRRLTVSMDSLSRSRALVAPLQAEVASLRGRLATGRVLSGWNRLSLTQRDVSNGRPRSRWEVNPNCIVELVGPVDDLDEASILYGGDTVATIVCLEGFIDAVAPSIRPRIGAIAQQVDETHENVFADGDGFRVTFSWAPSLGIGVATARRIP